jgi:hypothetical protein
MALVDMTVNVEMEKRKRKKKKKMTRLGGWSMVKHATPGGRGSACAPAAM